MDTAAVAEAGSIDYENLCSVARAAGIWEGSRDVFRDCFGLHGRYRGSGLDLPKFVTDSARFRGDAIYYARGSLRLPIMPRSARLYGAQLAGALADEVNCTLAFASAYCRGLPPRRWSDKSLPEAIRASGKKTVEAAEIESVQSKSAVLTITKASFNQEGAGVFCRPAKRLWAISYQDPSRHGTGPKGC